MRVCESIIYGPLLKSGILQSLRNLSMRCKGGPKVCDRHKKFERRT